MSRVRFDFAEIASGVGRSEAACRQLAVGARRHMNAGRPRFDADRREQERLADRPDKLGHLGPVADTWALLREAGRARRHAD
jgi:RNA polymerase sigma-70 factor (ECF subfamily)